MGISPVRSTLGPNQKPLDVLIVRGRKTFAAIGAAYRAAVAGTQVFALWDQKCAKSSCDLRLSRYDAHSSLVSEREDLKVRDQAMEVSVGAAPRCALLQVVSDTLPRAEEFKDGPVHHPAEVTAMMNDNHIESISASVASTVYATWLQHVRGCAFALLPHNTESWSNDIAGANMAVHRLVYGNATCSIEGHGVMVGLQLVHKFGEVNAGLLHGPGGGAEAVHGWSHDISWSAASETCEVLGRWNCPRSQRRHRPPESVSAPSCVHRTCCGVTREQK